MDIQLKTAPLEGRDVVRGGMPFERPADMPVQDLRTAPPAQKIGATPLRVVFARLLAALSTLGLAGYGVFEMLGIVSFSNMTVLQGVMIVFFSITLLWISFAAASAVTGFLIPPLRSPAAPTIAGSRTALVMPIYNEDPARTTAALYAMAEALAQIDAARHFEIAIISDSTNADAWIRESLAVDQLRRDLRETMPVWYRPPLAQHGTQRPATSRISSSAGARVTTT
jgi:membrane glycosyltransferase